MRRRKGIFVRLPADFVFQQISTEFDVIGRGYIIRFRTNRPVVSVNVAHTKASIHMTLKSNFIDYFNYSISIIISYKKTGM